MPRGGARIGAGRKPRQPREFEVIDGGAAFGAEAEALLTPPDSLTADEQAFWVSYAPLAIRQRTLTPSTVPNFLLLCELQAEKKAVRATLDTDGRTYIKAWTDSSGQEHQELKAHPLKSDYGKLAKDVDRLMARFMLAPFGKPMSGAQARTVADQQKAVTRQQFFGVARGK
jgi:hypothetical protein